jgi:hypothetical protein
VAQGDLPSRPLIEVINHHQLANPDPHKKMLWPCEKLKCRITLLEKPNERIDLP